MDAGTHEKPVRVVWNLWDHYYQMPLAIQGAFVHGCILIGFADESSFDSVHCGTQTLSFTYQYLAPVRSGLKYGGGAVGHVVKDAELNPNGLNVIGQILPGMSMNGAALFIDSNSMALQPTAETKTWW